LDKCYPMQREISWTIIGSTKFSVEVGGNCCLSVYYASYLNGTRDVNRYN
jgi:hypothetical protein